MWCCRPGLPRRTTLGQLRLRLQIFVIACMRVVGQPDVQAPVWRPVVTVQVGDVAELGCGELTASFRLAGRGWRSAGSRWRGRRQNWRARAYSSAAPAPSPLTSINVRRLTWSAI